MSTDKTLADVQPGGRVRLGDQAERARFKAWWDAARPLEGSAFPYEIAWAAWQAALSAQPSPGGQGALKALDDLAAFCSDDTETVERHVAVIRAALAARQPVGEPVAFIAQCELDSLRSIEGGNHLVTVWAKRTGQAGVPLYDAPGQTMDLTRLTRWTNYGSADEWDDVYEPDPDGEWVKYSDLLALIDSQAVGK